MDTVGGHYGIILETKKKKKNTDIKFVEDDTGILFFENARENCKATRKVHEVNNQKGKEKKYLLIGMLDG